MSVDLMKKPLCRKRGTWFRNSDTKITAAVGWVCQNVEAQINIKQIGWRYDRDTVVKSVYLFFGLWVKNEHVFTGRMVVGQWSQEGWRGKRGLLKGHRWEKIETVCSCGVSQRDWRGQMKCARRGRAYTPRQSREFGLRMATVSSTVSVKTLATAQPSSLRRVPLTCVD